MKPLEFVEGIRESVLESNFIAYKNLFLNSHLSDIKDEYWKKAILLFQSFNKEQQEVFFSIIRQIEIDTLSNVFGILDGTSFFSSQKEDFKLTTIESNDLINQELQDIFLELES